MESFAVERVSDFKTGDIPSKVETIIAADFTVSK